MSNVPTHLPHDGPSSLNGAAAGLVVGAGLGVVAAAAAPVVGGIVATAVGFGTAGLAVGALFGAMTGSDTADELDAPPTAAVEPLKEIPHA